MNRFFKKMLRGLSPSVWRLRRKLPFNWKEFGRKTDKAISYRSFFIGQKYARKEFKAFCLLLLLFSRTAVPNSLRRHGLQHTRPSCPSPSPKVCPRSRPLCQWCHPAISPSDTFFILLLPQSLPVSGTFPISWLFMSDDQNTGASASASALPSSIQSWFALRLISLISLLSRGLSEAFSSTTVWRCQFFGVLLSLWSSSHNCTWLVGRP